MRANSRFCQAVVWLGMVVLPATCVANAATAEILEVSTTAQLESAIINAQPGDVIVLAPGEYRPTAPLSVVVDVAIQGDASAPTVIDGGGANILVIRANNVRLKNLTLRNGSTAIGFSGSGKLVVSGVTMTGNTGAGLASDSGTVTMMNSTIAGSRTGLQVACAALTLRHVTIADNERGLHINFPCGDVFTVHNTLIARNGQDCVARGAYTLGGATSIDGDGTCRVAVTTGKPVFTTVLDAGLGPLADNGGPTMTMALSADSPAIDAGSRCFEPLDQRGHFRDSRCDVGAFERTGLDTLPGI